MNISSFMTFSCHKPWRVVMNQESGLAVERYRPPYKPWHTKWPQNDDIPDVAKPEHEIVQGLPLIEQLPEPHCSIFLQFQDLSVKGGTK